LTGREGEMIASEGLTMKDDATIGGGMVSRSFDSEGFPSKAITVIEKGRFTGFLHNLETSKMMGVESTGHALRDYRVEPIVYPSNVVIEHEKMVPLQKLIEETDSGLMAQGVIGTYSSDYVTGDFSVSLDECSLIETGDITRVKNVSIGGNIINLLRSIECVSNERRQCGHFILPFLKICQPLLLHV